MRVFLHEITDQETELTFTQEEKWVNDAVTSLDEKLEGESLPPANRERSIEVCFSLRKVDEVVVLSGNIQTSLWLICSRCANPYELICKPGFSALFCKDPVMAGVAHHERDEQGNLGRIIGQNSGKARHAHHFGEDDENGSQDLEITYVSADHIDLAEVLKEQLQLQVPFQPLCKDECKGICGECGADLNRGRCACAKLAGNRPFSVLKNLKTEINR